MNEKPWSRFRFSLRTLFALVAILGLFLGWLGVQLKWIRERHAALEGLEAVGYSEQDYRPAPWSIRWLERGVPVIVVDPDIAADPAKVARLKRLFPEARVLRQDFPLRGQFYFPPLSGNDTYRYTRL